MPIYLLLSEDTVSCLVPDWKFLANHKDQLQEGWVRNHIAFSKVWTYSRNCLHSDPTSWFALGTASDLPLNTYFLLRILPERGKKKKGSQTTMIDSGYPQVFCKIFYSGTKSWDLSERLISVPTYRFQDKPLQWKRGCGRPSRTSQHSSVSLLLFKKSRNYKLCTSIRSLVNAKAHC